MTAGFDALFDTFIHSAYRLETLPFYAIPAEDPSYRAYLDGLPRPERSVRTSPWMRRIAVTTAEGKDWARTRVIDAPLTDYERYEITSYIESQAVGERIGLVPREHMGDDQGPDFWLFDDATDTPFAALMDYGPNGEFNGYQLVDDVAVLDELRRRRRRAEAVASPLAEYLLVSGHG